MKAKKTISIGKVNWFGGTNRNTGRENNFGFISSYLGEDFYVHRDDLTNANLVEDQFVIFEEQKQRSNKKSAKNVQILHPKGDEVPQDLLRVLSLSTITTDIIAKQSYKQHLVAWLDGPHGKEILSQLEKSKKIRPSHLELIFSSKSADEFFKIYVEKYSFSDLYESKVSADHIPRAYLVANIESIINWWRAIDNKKIKNNLLDKGLSFVLSRTKHISELTDSYCTEKLIELIKQFKEEAPLSSKVIQFINMIDDQNQILNEYLKTATLNDLIDSEVQMYLLPSAFLTSKVEGAIEKIKLAETINKLQVNKKLLKLFLINSSYIESLLFGSNDAVAFAITEQFSIELPFNRKILSCIKDSKTLFVKYNHSYCLSDYLKEDVPINLLPEWYVSDQINKLFEDLNKAYFFKDKDISKDLLSFVLSDSTYRFIAIKQCKAIHPTNIFNLIQLLSYQDKLIEHKLLKGLIDSQQKLSDIPYLLPLLATQNSTFPDEFTSKNIGLIADWVQSLSGSKGDDSLKRSLEYFDSSCLLALVFKGVLNTNDISNRISEVDSFIFKLLRKQPTNLAPYVRDVYKSCFANFGEFSKNSVINPILLSNQTLLKTEQIKWKMYNKDLSFVLDIVNDATIASDPEYWFLAKLLPLINPDNSYETIQKIIIHELWQALLSGKVKVDHPSIFKLFPQCHTLASYFPHMALSCEAFIWRPKPQENEPIPEAKYLCRSKVCVDPQVVPDLNKPYFNYSAFDWLAHYGVNYSGSGGPARNDFPIKLAGYFNRIRELNDRLHCRSCQKLMTPNMNYARVEAVTIDPQTGSKITTPINAAYRLTIFHCNDPKCNQNGIGHYINHCLGFRCYEIIDSRDIKEQCSKGRYICQNTECRSCCTEHSSPPQHGISNNITHKHRELYKESPHFKSFKKQD